MRRFLVIALLAYAGSAVWAWDWFGLVNDEANTNTLKRLHVLLQPANEFIEEAEDAALDGDAEKAIDAYTRALDEIERVRRENPERAKKPEFAPLRNKAAACQAAIDSIRFDQISRNVRAVAVTDTTELQKRYDRKHGILHAEKEALSNDVAFAKQVTNELVAATNRTNQMAKPVTSVGDESWRTNNVKQLDFNGRYRMAWHYVRVREFTPADLILEELLKEQPRDLDVLLLRAAAQAGSGNRFAARRTLEKATRTHPRDARAYHNLAYLALAMGESVEDARGYYEMAREFGGARDKRLEAKMKALEIRAREAKAQEARRAVERAKIKTADKDKGPLEKETK